MMEQDKSSIVQKIAYSFEKFLNDNLSGSGIDAGFQLRYISDKNIFIASSFHCMNEHGYYDGWQDFTIILPLHGSPTEWKLQFNQGQKKAEKYVLREYLEDTIHEKILEFYNTLFNE